MWERREERQFFIGLAKAGVMMDDLCGKEKKKISLNFRF